MKMFLALLLAHFIADFVTKNRHMEPEKQLFTTSFYSEGLLRHSIHHLVISFVLCITFLGWCSVYLIIIPLIATIHYFIDVAKIKWGEPLFIKAIAQQKGGKGSYHFLLGKGITYFIGAQLIHLTSLYTIVYIFGYNLSKTEFMQLFSADIYQTDAGMRYLVLGLLILLVTYPSASFISILISDFQDLGVEDEAVVPVEPQGKHMKELKNSLISIKRDLVVTESYGEAKGNYTLQVQYHKYNNLGENPRGRYIGILERVLIVIFIVQSFYQGLALIIAMKTLTRFKQFENKSFAEYYLIGTLLSLIIGIVFAIAIKEIW